MLRHTLVARSLLVCPPSKPLLAIGFFPVFWIDTSRSPPMKVNRQTRRKIPADLLTFTNRWVVTTVPAGDLGVKPAQRALSFGLTSTETRWWPFWPAVL